MTKAELERKFRGNVGQRWPEARTSTILEALWNLDRADDLAALLGKLALQA
jgi:2-methylcitrate dehydratase